MKINANDRYYSLLLKALQESVVPELTSSSAQASAHMMSVVLTELLKREHGSLSILQSNILEGQNLLSEIVAELKISNDYENVTELKAQSFAGLIEIHGLLTDSLAEACNGLRKSALDPEMISSMLLRAAEWELSYYEESAALQAPELPTVTSKGTPLSAKSLERYLNNLPANAGKNIKIASFAPMPGGFGKQTYLCQCVDQDGVKTDLVIRKTDNTPIMTHGGCFLESEYSLLKSLATTGFLSPNPYDFCANWDDVDGSFYTMAKASGATPGSFLGGVEGELPESLFLELAEWLGRLHSISLDVFADHIEKYNDPRILKGSVADAYKYNLEGWEKYISEAHHLSSPYIIWLLDWLKNNIPADANKPVLVHGDYNVHNVLADDGKITIILDWECADFGTPEQDLAYIKPNIEAHIDWDKFVAHYQRHGGKKDINEQAMKFGAVYSALRTNLAGNRGTFNLQTGRNHDLRYIMIELGFTHSFMNTAMNNAKDASETG